MMSKDNDEEIKIQRLQRLLLDRETSKFIFHGMKEITNDKLLTFTHFQNELQKLYTIDKSPPLGQLGELVLASVNADLKNTLVMLQLLETINRNILENRKSEKSPESQKQALDFLEEYRSTLRFVKRDYEDKSKDTTTE